MRSKTVVLVLASLFVIYSAGLCFAQGLPITKSIEVSFENPSITQATVYADPSGLTGYGLDNCFENGNPIDATLKVRVLINGAPIANFERQRIKLVILDAISSQPGSALFRECGGATNVADENTDRGGWTTISASRFFVYGTLQDAPYDVRYAIYVDWGGSGAWEMEYWGDEILVKTADFTGDAIVNVSDVGVMAAYFHNGVYDVQADFNGDGVEDLTDVGMISASLGAACDGAAASGVSLSVEELLAEMERAAGVGSTTWGAVKSRY